MAVIAMTFEVMVMRVMAQIRVMVTSRHDLFRFAMTSAMSHGGYTEVMATPFAPHGEESGT